LPSAYFGATIRDRNGTAVVTSIEWDSPAWHSGLSIQDSIIEMDGVKASVLTIENLLKSKRPSDSLRILVSRREQNHEIDLVLGRKFERTFRIKPIDSPSPLQSAILKSWAIE
jgi:predicted metalloprotease with PDZ domain